MRLLVPLSRKTSAWAKFCKEYDKSFKDLFRRYGRHQVFSDVDEEDVEKLFLDVILYIRYRHLFCQDSPSVLHRMKERYLLLFLHQECRRYRLLESYEDNCFELITPDLIYDYFEPLLKRRYMVEVFMRITC